MPLKDAMNALNKKFFTKSLMQWHELHNNRSLPWKNEKDPYKIWLSEIILQQTRSEQGLPYYLKFVKAFPNIKKLSAAKDEDVFRMWQGLGYYNRCKNMLATARQITNEHKGIFPTEYHAILSLKGIGNYTAAAISSFAYNLPHAVVDGNVYRVLSRFFGIEEPIDSTNGKKYFQLLAEELLDKKSSAAYNQAIMDLGATVCTPAKPACNECPLRKNCFAHCNTLIDRLPLKSKKLVIRKRFFNFLILKMENKIWIEQRMEKDIWQNLYQPLLIESSETLSSEALQKTKEFNTLRLSEKKITHESIIKQKLTHQFIEANFFSITISDNRDMPAERGFWVNKNQLKNYAFPKTVLSFFEKSFYF